MKKTAVFILLYFWFFNSAFSQVISAEGDLTTNTIWDADTVKITGNVTVLNGVTLAIAPGTVISAQGFFRIQVLGSIIASGTENDSIIFTVQDTSLCYLEDTLAGGWGGIHLDSVSETNDSSIFEYCGIYYGKSFNNGGGVYLKYNNKVRFDHCTFFHNMCHWDGGGMVIEYSDCIIRNCEFYKNNGRAHGGGLCSYGGKPYFENNLFYKNYTSG